MSQPSLDEAQLAAALERAGISLEPDRVRDLLPGAAIIQRLDDPAPGASNLFAIQPNGTQLRAVTAYAVGASRAGWATWTPDGRSVILTLVDGILRRRQIAFVDPNGLDLRIHRCISACERHLSGDDAGVPIDQPVLRPYEGRGSPGSARLALRCHRKTEASRIPGLGGARRASPSSGAALTE